eukprot:298918-Pyramimonas_sp.AAC.1
MLAKTRYATEVRQMGRWFSTQPGSFFLYIMVTRDVIHSAGTAPSRRHWFMMSRRAPKSVPVDVASTLKASMGTSPSTTLFPLAILRIALRSSAVVNCDSTTGNGK